MLLISIINYYKQKINVLCTNFVSTSKMLQKKMKGEIAFYKEKEIIGN